MESQEDFKQELEVYLRSERPSGIGKGGDLGAGWEAGGEIEVWKVQEAVVNVESLETANGVCIEAGRRGRKGGREERNLWERIASVYLLPKGQRGQRQISALPA